MTFTQFIGLFSAWTFIKSATLQQQSKERARVKQAMEEIERMSHKYPSVHLVKLFSLLKIVLQLGAESRLAF
jgi:hypothetical protein